MKGEVAAASNGLFGQGNTEAWKWIIIGAFVTILLNMGWGFYQWMRSTDVRQENVEMRLMQLERAVISKHPELGQAPSN